jgi:tetratricopeptide (TPR) repeat protein
MNVRTGPILLPGLLGSLLILAGCSTIPPAGSRDALRRAEQALADGDYQEGVTLARAYLAAAPDRAKPEELARANLVAAEGLLARGSYEESTEHFRSAKAGASTPDLQVRVARGLGDVAYRQRRFADAQRQYELTLRLALTEPARREINYRLAVCAKAQGRTVEAARYLTKAGGYRPSARDPLRYEAVSFAPYSRTSFPSLAQTPGPRATPATAPRPWQPTAALASASGIPPVDRSPPTVLPRSAWGASPARHNTAPMGRVRRITIHHTAKAVTDPSRAAGARELKGIQRYHQGNRHWADIAYHYLIDRGGRIWEGRSNRQRGAHAGSTSSNQNNLGICLLGHFDQQDPAPEQLASLAHLVDWLCSRHHLGLDEVYTHREIKKKFNLSGTACPGGRLQQWVEQLRRVRSGVVTRGPRPTRYRVQRGDTLYAIARRFQVPQAELERHNPGVTSRTLLADTWLRIPR